MPSGTEERMVRAIEMIEMGLGHGLPLSDMHVDPLVIPIGVDAEAGTAYLEAVRQLRHRFGPELHITGGVSNVSFGMPARRLISDVFLDLCVQAGQDSGIVDPVAADVARALAPDRDSETYRLAADLLTGVDAFGVEFLEAFRSGRLSGPGPGAARTMTPRRSSSRAVRRGARTWKSSSHSPNKSFRTSRRSARVRSNRQPRRSDSSLARCSAASDGASPVSMKAPRSYRALHSPRTSMRYAALSSPKRSVYSAAWSTARPPQRAASPRSQPFRSLPLLHLVLDVPVGARRRLVLASGTGRDLPGRWSRSRGRGPGRWARRATQASRGSAAQAIGEDHRVDLRTGPVHLDLDPFTERGGLGMQRGAELDHVHYMWRAGGEEVDGAQQDVTGDRQQMQT